MAQRYGTSVLPCALTSRGLQIKKSTKLRRNVGTRHRQPKWDANSSSRSWRSNARKRISLHRFPCTLQHHDFFRPGAAKRRLMATSKIQLARTTNQTKQAAQLSGESERYLQPGPAQYHSHAHPQVVVLAPCCAAAAVLGQRDLNSLFQICTSVHLQDSLHDGNCQRPLHNDCQQLCLTMLHDTTCSQRSSTTHTPAFTSKLNSDVLVIARGGCEPS